MIILFAGPSIAGLDFPDTSTLEIRPPAQQGDIYLAALEEPEAIGVIDGYFEGVPAVWHKEILWAMIGGTAVWGASSMGALRAAELADFGMIGVGAIFEAYRNETLEDDDEVALLHGPQELGYPALSLAMVNVRATLQAAEKAGVMNTQQARTLEQSAKSLFYKIRTWDQVFSTLDPNIWSKSEVTTQREWVDGHAIDQKAKDAQVLINRLLQGDITPPRPNYHFEETDLWLNATRIWRQRDTIRAEPQDQEYRLFDGASLLDK